MIDTSKIKGKFLTNEPLKNYNWFKVGGNANYMYWPDSIQDLINFIKNNKERYVVLGAGSIILIKDSGIKAIVIKTANINFIEQLDATTIKVGAGLLNSSLCLYAKNNNISGLEFISGIPGSIGGGVYMNAGCYGFEFKDIIENIEIINSNGDLINFKNQDCGFEYRKSSIEEGCIIVSVTLKGVLGSKEDIEIKLKNIKQQREEQQPKKVLTGGSTFANPEGEKAWKLLDSVGLRGYKIGGAYFSEKHCNFIINDGTATSQDIEDLINLAKEKVYHKYNIVLKEEIKIKG